MAKVNILIVEDEAIVAKDIQQSLVKNGYNVTECVSTGDMALRSIINFRPDLIILDIMLKGELSGVDVSMVVKERYGIPVIFLTAYADQSTLERAKITDPYGYILKPFKEVDLHTTIEIALYKHKGVMETIKERDMFRSIIVDSNGDVDEGIHFIKSNSKYVRLLSDDIWFIEALKDYVTVNTEVTKYTIHSTMKEIESKLPSKVFIRVHRSFIVNKLKIAMIESNSLTLEGEKKIIPIGGAYKESLLKKINLF